MSPSVAFEAELCDECCLVEDAFSSFPSLTIGEEGGEETKGEGGENEKENYPKLLRKILQM